MNTASVTPPTEEETLTLPGVRAQIWANHAEADADPGSVGPDTLEQACGHEAYFILDLYSRSEGWDTNPEEINNLHQELVRVGIGAAKGAMIDLAAYRLAGTRRIEA
jgi:hypothetical protein